jgi:uncharacterized protein YjlB
MEKIIISEWIGENGNFPNNPQLPLLLYKDAVELPEKNPAKAFEDVFGRNQWEAFWRDGIFDYHHYHSTAHEVLGIYSGKATVQFGGPDGFVVDVKAGDVVIIPAGVAHKNLSSSHDFACVGGYPTGQDYDMNYGKDGERPGTDNMIKKVEMPLADPVFGTSGGLFDHWPV